MNRIIVSALLFLMGAASMSAQTEKDYRDYFSEEELAQLEVYEDTLGLLGHLVVNDTSETRRLAACKQFILKFKNALKVRNSFHYPFDQIKTLSIQQPEDGSFRIFTWQLYVDKEHYQYFGAIQMKADELKLYPLIDRSHQVEDIEYDILKADQWFGALYYNVHQFETNEGRKYLLFGYDANSFFQKRKLIDVLSFRAEGPVFGAPVFANVETGRRPVTKNRHLMQYSAESSVKLNFDELHNMIVFDHLVEMKGIPGQGMTAYPDGSYEGFKLQDGLWVYVDKLFHQINEEAPREEPVLNVRGRTGKRKDLFGNQ